MRFGSRTGKANIGLVDLIGRYSEREFQRLARFGSRRRCHHTIQFDELETALMEMVKQDNRRQLCARILMRFEQDQKETEDACRFAEQNVAAQRYFVEVLQV
ncbi:hypothetical protein V6Z12_D11G102900 [Gossypium hirsutum]